MKHGVIRELAGAHPVRKLCRVFGVARSAYYAAQRKAERPRARDNVRLGAKARELFEASGRTYGSPRLTVARRRAGETCGRRRVDKSCHQKKADQPRAFARQHYRATGVEAQRSN